MRTFNLAIFWGTAWFCFSCGASPANRKDLTQNAESSVEQDQSRDDIIDALHDVEKDVAECHDSYDIITSNIVIGPNGNVEDLELSTRYADTDVSKCVEGIIRNLKFSKRSESIKVKKPFRLGPKSDKDHLFQPGGEGTLTRVDIIETLSAEVDNLADCDKGVGNGIITVKIVILPTGDVEHASVVGEYADTDIGACVLSVLEKVRFPKSNRGTMIRYPFKLR